MYVLTELRKLPFLPLKSDVYKIIYMASPFI